MAIHRDHGKLVAGAIAGAAVGFFNCAAMSPASARADWITTTIFLASICGGIGAATFRRNRITWCVVALVEFASIGLFVGKIMHGPLWFG